MYTTKVLTTATTRCTSCMRTDEKSMLPTKPYCGVNANIQMKKKRECFGTKTRPNLKTLRSMPTAHGLQRRIRPNLLK